MTQYNALDHIILRTEVGSTAYGTGLPGHEDLDHMAVCVETEEQTIGLEKFDHLIHRPGRGPHDPSGPGDLDLTVYSLRKWARLALKGNPSVLMLLFGPLVDIDTVARPLLDLRHEFATKHAQKSFLGYIQQQRERMQGIRGAAGRIRRNPNVKCETCGGDGETDNLDEPTFPRCPTCHGAGVAVDWKYAMHMVRLAYQGYGYLMSGEIAVPIPDPMRSVLIDIRHGRIPLSDVLAETSYWEDSLKNINAPDTAPFAKVQKTIIDIYKEYWSRERH